MQQFMLCVTYTTNPGMREKFIKEINSRGLLDKILKEDGCLEYEYYLSVKNADDVLLVERWESEELQQVHLKQIHMEELKSIKERYISGVSVRKSFLE